MQWGNHSVKNVGSQKHCILTFPEVSGKILKLFNKIGNVDWAAGAASILWVLMHKLTLSGTINYCQLSEKLSKSFFLLALFWGVALYLGRVISFVPSG